jgi:putative ABC transport system permease protein
VLEVRRAVKIVEGRMVQPGLAELVVGKNAAHTYRGAVVGANNSKTLVPLALGNTVDFGGGHWKIVGIFDAGGSAFDSEIWCDAPVLNEVLKRPDNLFQSVTAHLTSADAFDKFKDSLTTDPRMNVDVSREIDYYSKQSRVMTTLITVLGGFVAGIMAIGAVFGALNTMYSAVAERGREIATMRALGFAGSSVVLSFLVEALLIALVGGLVGCIAVLPLNGLTTSTMNFQTFSNLAFAFKITPVLLVQGVLFALVMGVVGGLLPAARAAVQPVATALRSL